MSPAADGGAAEHEFDAVVLGLGPGGEEVAGRLAEAGWRVAGIDAELVGGECPYWGCIPSKMMVRAAGLLAEGRRIDGVAGTAEIVPDWGPVARRIRDEATDDWDDTVAVERFEGKGGTFVRGRGRIVARDTVEVDGVRYRATRALVVATGGTPSVPPIDGIAGTPYWTNRDVVRAEAPPASIVVLGGGAIGAEFAQVLARFGSRVTVVEAADRLLANEEPAAGRIVEDVFTAEGIEVVTGVGAEHVAHDAQGAGSFRVRLADGRIVEAERLLVATGRRVDLDAIGAGELGIDLDGARALPVDERLRVTERVWAVGDVTGRGAFTHVAMYQARLAVADILGEPSGSASYDALPRVTFTDPEVASVGSSERAARDAGIDVAVGSAAVPSTARGWLHGPGNDGVIHLVADRARGVLVGATVVGPHAGEVLGLLVLAVHAAIPLSTLRSMIYAYPTFHRGIEDALRDLG